MKQMRVKAVEPEAQPPTVTVCGRVVQYKDYHREYFAMVEKAETDTARKLLTGEDPSLVAWLYQYINHARKKYQDVVRVLNEVAKIAEDLIHDWAHQVPLTREGIYELSRIIIQHNIKPAMA